MALILTTSCDYALLVAIADGTGFPSFSDRDIFLHSRLALHLPDTVGDLIPPSTIISAKPVKLEPNPQWRTTLVYFLSAKLLKRLKRRRAQVTLQVTTMTERGDMYELGTVELHVDHAKTIKVTQRRHQQQPPLNILKHFVIDKGDWKPINKDGGTATKDCVQIKVGLFVVKMPIPACGPNQEQATPLPRHHHGLNKQPAVENNSHYDDLRLEIHSMDNSDDATEMGGNNDNGTDTNCIVNQQKISTTSSSTSTATMPSSSDGPPTHNKKENLSQCALMVPSQPITNCFRMMPHKSGPFPYLQIGDGSQRYTFVLRLVEATAVSSLTPTDDPQLITNKTIGNSNSTIQKLMQYTFSDWKVKHDVITKGNSWLVTERPMCLSLQGHLHDIQQWLSQQGHIEVCLVLVNRAAKYEHTIGKSMVRLKVWCPLGIEQASFPIHDRSNRLHVDQPFQFARVVVQSGLVDSWRNDLDGQQMDISVVNRNRKHTAGGGESSDSSVQQQKHSFLIK